MIVSGHQPNYLPWLGFFDKMQRSNLFIIEDNVQFENRGFTNRVQIKQQSEPRWLTVPVEGGNKKKAINEIKISRKGELDWARRHWLSIKYHYSKAPFWDTYSSFFEDAYKRSWERLIDLNLHLINGLKSFFGIETPLIFASKLKAKGHKSDLILTQCKILNTPVFLAGAGSRDYIDVESFKEQNVTLLFQEFKHPIYKQVHGQFIPKLSAIDFLFCCGGNSFSLISEKPVSIFLTKKPLNTLAMAI